MSLASMSPLREPDQSINFMLPSTTLDQDSFSFLLAPPQPYQIKSENFPFQVLQHPQFHQKELFFLAEKPEIVEPKIIRKVEKKVKKDKNLRKNSYLSSKFENIIKKMDKSNNSTLLEICIQKKYQKPVKLVQKETMLKSKSSIDSFHSTEPLSNSYIEPICASIMDANMFLKPTSHNDEELPIYTCQQCQCRGQTYRQVPLYQPLAPDVIYCENIKPQNKEIIHNVIRNAMKYEEISNPKKKKTRKNLTYYENYSNKASMKNFPKIFGQTVIRFITQDLFTNQSDVDKIYRKYGFNENDVIAFKNWADSNKNNYISLPVFRNVWLGIGNEDENERIFGRMLTELTGIFLYGEAFSYFLNSFGGKFRNSDVVMQYLDCIPIFIKGFNNPQYFLSLTA